MKLTHILSFLLALLLVAACEDDITMPDLASAEPPSELSLDFSITPDNTGTVTVLPGGRGVTSFTVDFGDGAVPSSTLAPGETVNHVYDEGVYTVTLEAMNINGATTSYTEELTVSFRAPENLNVTVTLTPGNALSVDVTATADLETNFLAYFGEDPDADPVSFQEGETVSYEYAGVGSYDIRVVALSGGAASVEDTVTVTIENPVLLPLTFEDDTKEYAVFGFGGASAEVVANPDASGANTSARVVKLNKSAGSEVWAGSVIELGDAIDFTEEQQLSMKVWSPAAGTAVLLKLENGANNELFTEVTANTTLAGQWEELTFDFSGADFSVAYSKVVIFFDFGTSGTGTDYYYDDIMTTGGAPEVSLPLTFDAADLTYNWIGFGGAEITLVDNPDVSAGNPSGRVGQLVKGEGAETWAGGVLELPSPIDFSNGAQLMMKVWSPAAGVPVLLKVENADDSGTFIEVVVNTTVANQWEELTFDYSGGNVDAAYSKVAVFFNFGNPGTGATYYFDDIRLAGDAIEETLRLPLNFESATQTFEWIGFGGATAEIVDNPDATGENTSSRVAKLNKGNGSETWAGAVIQFPDPIDFSANGKLSMKVWSPAAGIPVLLKVENASDSGVSIEVTQNTTVANAWETLTFDYAGGNLDADYSKLVVFFDFGTAGTGADYYFDDIRQIP